MNAPANTRSFRLRLALQTMLVAGALVAAFGSAAWWYASQTLERSVDDRIIAPAQRVWHGSARAVSAASGGTQQRQTAMHATAV